MEKLRWGEKWLCRVRSGVAWSGKDDPVGWGKVMWGQVRNGTDDKVVSALVLFGGLWFGMAWMLRSCA